MEFSTKEDKWVRLLGIPPKKAQAKGEEKKNYTSGKVSTPKKNYLQVESESTTCETAAGPDRALNQDEKGAERVERFEGNGVENGAL